MQQGSFILAALASLSCAALGRREPPPPPPAPPAAPVLDEGAAAPEVTAIGPGDKQVRLSDFRGKSLVVYFYPVDFGSSATAQAEEFKADHGKYRKLGVTVVGVSTDHTSSHRDFSERFKIPFLLLSDPQGELARAFGVPLEAGTTRHYTFFIDRRGVIKKSWKNVRAWGHSAEVLGYIKAKK
jgi:thioredoxin-dependent peroxiredoxin